VVLAFVGNDVNLGEESEACEVLQGIARHYDWIFALRIEQTELADELGDLSADICLFPTMPAQQLTAQENPAGGGLNSEFWASDALLSMDRACLYGDVPAELDPKLVIERIAALP